MEKPVLHEPQYLTHNLHVEIKTRVWTETDPSITPTPSDRCVIESLKIDEHELTHEDDIDAFLSLLPKEYVEMVTGRWEP